MLMVDEEGIGERLCERLRGEGEKVVVVRKGKEYRRAGEMEYEIRVEEAEDYRRLLVELSEGEGTPSNILHMWALGRAENCYRDRCDTHEKCGFYSLLFLAQALGERVLAQSLGQGAPQSGIEITVISSNAQKVLSKDQVCPEKAMILGPCRVTPLEYPGVTCRSVDIPDPETFNSQDEILIDALLSEMTSSSDDLAIAYREGDRWVQVYDPVRFQERSGQPPLLKRDGVYLITGGLGGVGLALAEAIAGLVPAKIILLGRSAFPEKDQWNQWLNAQSERNEIGEKIRKIVEIEQKGAEILALGADVSNEFEMSRIAEVIRSQFGRVHGVIHAAGLPPAGLMQLKTREAAEEILRPKVDGTRILSRLFKDSDFMIFCSSLRAISPIPGMVDYCAANLFLDAFALSRKAGDGARTISINWDGWTEVGMGSKVVSRPAPERDQAVGLTTQEGIEAFKRLLRNQLPQILVSTSDLESALKTNNGLTTLNALEQLEKINPPRSFYPRPQLFTTYEAPTNEVEEALVEIWQNLLGIAPIGIHDNFFELGGDSIVSLQIIAKANQAGLSLSPGKVFESQTIAELAQSAGQGVAIVAEQGAITGPVPLTPAQHWFFEQELSEQHHWNQAYLFEVREPVNPVWLEKAIESLLFQHDALRLRFHRGSSGWEQTISEPSGETPLVCIDLGHLSGDEQTTALTGECERLQASLDLSQGPIARFALFGLGHGQNERLLIVIHHLAVDALSWRILLDDLLAAYKRLSRNEEVELLPKTTSFKYWAESLNKYARSDDLKNEIEYWTDPSFSQVLLLPVDHHRGVNTVASTRDITVSLDLDDTRNLLHEIPQIRNAKVTEVLLAALGRSLGRWAGSGKLLIGLESHGREPLFSDVELGRTVGWFTAFYPVLLDVESGADGVSALKLVKEQIRGVRNRGIGYGALRYLSGEREIAERLRALPEPEISFLYLGQQEQDTGGALTMRMARESFGSLRSSRGLRSTLLELTAQVAGGQLRLTWSYSENIHRRAVIEKLAQDYLEEIRSLISQCLSSNAGFYTPSDFPEAEFSQSDLDDIMAELSEFEE
jgi:non-ribosomal peptide synthase protein (TIGR01720 family)